MVNDKRILGRRDGGYFMIDSLNNILKSFKIKAECVGAKKHRHFAYYDVTLEPGTRISRLQRYANELAIAMRANSSIIIKPIPREGIVRLQTTTSKAKKLDFNELYKFNKAPSDHILPFLLGETDEGKPLWMDIAKNPHLLVAGSTGSGKSVFLHTLIANAAKRHDVSLHLVDTKRVEFNIYREGLADVVTSVSNTYDEAINTFSFLHDLMESRYLYMSKIGVKSIEDQPNIFNKIVLIVDEAADLMLYEKGKVFEDLAIKLAQKARAAGIYMVFATQRPSVDVFTGLIKANFPARLSCKVTSKVDSKVILDQQGAESLIGRGDAILNNSNFDMTRLQVAYSEPAETILGN